MFSLMGGERGTKNAQNPEPGAHHTCICAEFALQLRPRNYITSAERGHGSVPIPRSDKGHKDLSLSFWPL